MISFVWLTFVSLFASDFFFWISLHLVSFTIIVQYSSIISSFRFQSPNLLDEIKFFCIWRHWFGSSLFVSHHSKCSYVLQHLFFITIIVTLLSSEISMRLHKRQSDLQSIIGLEQSKPNDHNEARVWREKSDIRKYNKIQL